VSVAGAVANGSERAPDRATWPWFAVAGFVCIAAVGCVLVAVNEESLAEQIPFVMAFGMFGVVGALILSRSPRNRIGALLLWGSSSTATAFLAGELVTWSARRGQARGLLPLLAGIGSSLGWIVGILPVLLFLPLLFPDGRLPSRRWRFLGWMNAGFLVFLAIGAVFAERRFVGNQETASVENPLYVPALGQLGISDAIINVLLLACLFGTVACIVVRFRRARGVERQQIKWVAASLGFLLASFVVSAVGEALTGTNILIEVLLGGIAFMSLPVSIGVGVLQYRLYELDVVVKKALIAGTLVLLVIGIYAGVVALFGTVASGGESSASLFAIALVLGLAFRPVARFARRVADRLVYGRRATPYEVLTEFSDRVGDAYATDDVLGRMAQILGQGVGAIGARVWLSVGGQLRPASSWPADAPGVEPLEVRGDEILDVPGEVAVEVRDRGELLGALSVIPPPNDPMTPAKEKLVRDLASQAGLALRNVRLVEELKASQRRIVAAQDQERRRIERNIHDGAQQQLVALTVKMRLAQTLATRDAEKTATMLEQMQRETQTALEDLRDLARGIYPPLLADKGLVAALEAQVRKTGVDVAIRDRGIGRYRQDLESAVYFSVLEALQNVAKYAGASRVEVELADARGELSFDVRDDGRGFDPSATTYGTGLQGIVDRVSALDGTLEVRSSPGEGTALIGRIPASRVDAAQPVSSTPAEAPVLTEPEPARSA
jgi:signal transduction histidine kinase